MPSFKKDRRDMQTRSSGRGHTSQLLCDVIFRARPFCGCHVGVLQCTVLNGRKSIFTVATMTSWTDSYLYYNMQRWAVSTRRTSDRSRITDHGRERSAKRKRRRRRRTGHKLRVLLLPVQRVHCHARFDCGWLSYHKTFQRTWD